MTAQRPDQPTLEARVALEQCADGDAHTGEPRGTLSANACVDSIHPFQDFECLRESPWADAYTLVRAVMHLEAARLTKSGGWASAIKSAYRTMEGSNCVGAMELVARIVDRSDNDYVSFLIRKIRHVFPGITGATGSCLGCREALEQWCADRWGRQRRVAEEVANQKWEGERQWQSHVVVAAQLNAKQAEIKNACAWAWHRPANQFGLGG